MALKEQLLAALKKSQQVQEAFIAGVPAAERAKEGTYESWCVKDIIGHIASWQEHQAERLQALAKGKELPPAPSFYEQANAAYFQRFCQQSWDDVTAFAKKTRALLLKGAQELDEEVLAAPPPDGENPLWMAVIGTDYSHVLMHMADYYNGRGQSKVLGPMWLDWGKAVAPLDQGAEWQGLVHYNMACGLALSGHRDEAIAELGPALKLRPSLVSWSRHDSDLASLQEMPEYRKLYAPEAWWKALDSGPQAEALADQMLRTVNMLRQCILAFPAKEWRKGDTPYQRPAGLALHAVESLADFAALKAGEAGADHPIDVAWDVKDSKKLPTQKVMLAYLDMAEAKWARLLAEADLSAAESQFRWTGATLWSRGVYVTRHVQHHLAEMCLELHRRGLKAPQWQ